MILDGIEIAEKIGDAVQKKIAELKNSVVPSLTCVVSSNDKSTRVYLNSIKKNCDKFGINYAERSVNAENILSEIDKLNADTNVHGIMIMHPLPKEIDEFKVLSSVNPEKDVEGRTPQNLGMLLMGRPYFAPCTAQAVLEMLKYYEIQLRGKEVTIVGRSTTVGKPLSLLLLSEDATVTVCHSKTKDLVDKVKNADVVIAAVGKPKMFDASWFKDGEIVIDVGINVVDGKIVGDVDFDSVSKKVSVSKVPGGVGNVTAAILMRNVVNVAEMMCRR
ncbi:MAG: bifunctional 5,10-methylenetetrahydrofolate dehydrogenase/5,10-methenyltetrahydrofolate cyclohydrolase [Athalassotoga sp.]|uniref:bifunctional 5,10-methylenetetrahydrofolate dehydrogenase/5,10-methenyltetrahydrofolate cyclohydrolase n=1 Tax=Athalassotoga sp. TaxID=2022597 RepID=UPI003D048A75